MRAASATFPLWCKCSNWACWRGAPLFTHRPLWIWPWDQCPCMWKRGKECGTKGEGAHSLPI